MPILEDAKRTIERITGYRRPDATDLGLLTQDRKAHLLRFKDDGEGPNNSRLAMILYRSAVRLPDRFDPAAVFEDLFATNGWEDSHEVLGIARGTVRAQFGGGDGKTLDLKAGDVVRPEEGCRCAGDTGDFPA